MLVEPREWGWMIHLRGSNPRFYAAVKHPMGAGLVSLIPVREGLKDSAVNELAHINPTARICENLESALSFLSELHA